MKKNFIIALVLTIISFLLVIAAVVFQTIKNTDYSVYVSMGATVLAFFAVLFGVNSWKDR